LLPLLTGCRWYNLFSGNNEVAMPSTKKKIEEEHGRTLTNRQVTFARHIVEGIYSNAECARKAGYSHEVANNQASKLLNGREYPHVLEYIQDLRTERERRYGVTTIGQLERLHQLSSGAEDAGQFSAAINAEKIRAALGGLTVDRREQVNTIDQLSRDEIVGRLADLQKKYPQAFQIEGDYKDVTNEQGTGSELLELNTVETAEEVLRDKD
tara:strand:- start:244 stop:876 length:633 start_codon:yes stop_codon:yes gene_type:complete